MLILLRTFAILLSFFITSNSFAQEVVGKSESVEQVADKSKTEPLTVNQQPEVGKHVMASTDASSMILSLLMVLALIFISAWVLKRFNVTQQHSNQLKIVASLSLGVKERLVVAQVGEQQLVLGVTPQQITLIQNLEEPITSDQTDKASALTGNVLAFLQKNNFNTKTNSK